MFGKSKITFIILTAGALLMAACGGKSADLTPTVDANAIMTAAASTVQAELTQVAALTPSATPTIEPSATSTPETPTVQPSPTVTLAPLATSTPPHAADTGLYISQSVADGTKVDPGSDFTQVWTIKNTGTTTWTTSYSLRFFSGDPLGASNKISLPKEVKPNDQVEISVPMHAPSGAGNYTSNWVLTNADGLNFYNVFLQITVNGQQSSSTSTPGSDSTATATQDITEAPTEAPTATP